MLLSFPGRTPRRLTAAAALAGGLVFAAPPLPAQFAPPESGAPDPERHKATLALFADRDSYAPGAEARLAAVVAIAEGWHLQGHVPTYDYLIPTVLTVEPPPGFDGASVAIDYPPARKWKFAFAEDELDVYEGEQRIFVTLRIPAGAPERATLAARLRYQACDDKMCLPPVEAAATVELSIGAEGASTHAERFAPRSAKPAAHAAAKSASPAAAPAAGPSRWSILLLALLGGFILNGMPCVLPILSLKLFGLVKSSGQSRGAIRAGALAASAGILVSFWALAVAAIVAKQAGAAIGWGVQFQQPGFVAFLTIVVLLFSLNLWGLFEIPLPARLARIGDSASGQASDPDTGLGGHFASGLFSTLMATPCSAPFLGTALSFALGQSGTVIFLVLTAVGVGLALPYLLLAAVPRAAALLPRPGAWMDTLRGALGFLLAGAVVWLLFVLSGQVDAVSLAFFELGLLVLALFVWIRHRRFSSGRSTGVAWLLVAAAAIVLIGFAARAPRVSHTERGTGSVGAIEWIPFDRAEAERLAASGRLVFLDITADWCVTCKVNEKLILNSPEVQAAFRDRDIVAMKADWTNRDDQIARFLAEHGRYGIPFYMLYRPGRPPHVFGELLSVRGVTEVLLESATAPTR